MAQEDTAALKDRPPPVAPPEAVIREARQRQRRRQWRIGAGVVTTVALSTAVAFYLSQGSTVSRNPSPIIQTSPQVASPTILARAKTGTINGSIYLGRSPGKVIAIPASVTFRSRSGKLVTTKATSTGLFNTKVSPGVWTVSNVAPSVFMQFCANPRSLHVLPGHVETVDVQVACVSGGGGGYFGHRG